MTALRDSYAVAGVTDEKVNGAVQKILELHDAVMNVARPCPFRK